MDQIRLGYYKFAKPLIFVNVTDESPSLSGLRQKIENYIIQAKGSAGLEDASVYFRKMNNGSYFNINPEKESITRPV